MKLSLSAIAVAALAGAAFGQSTVFNNQASFVGQLQGAFLFDDFASIPTGLQTNPLVFSGNGFSATVGAVDSAVDGNGTDDGLFNDPGILSTNSATDAIRFDFGAGTTAVGGNFFASDINFSPIPLTLTFNLSDGTSQTVNTAGSNDFTGFINLSGISSMVVDAPDAGGTFNWAAAEALWVGRAVPTPGALAVLGMAGIAATRRRR